MASFTSPDSKGLGGGTGIQVAGICLVSEGSASCCICYNDIDQSERASCISGKADHVMCKSCFTDYIINEFSNLLSFSNRDCCINCPFCLVEKPTIISCYTTKFIVNHIDDTVAASYMNAVRSVGRLEEKVKADAMEDRLTRRIDKVRLEERTNVLKLNERERLELHRIQILGEHGFGGIFEKQFSHCDSICIVLSDNCCLVNICKCGNFLCGWCNECYSDYSDCHHHVLVCPLSLNPGCIFARNGEGTSMEQIFRARAPYRGQKIEEYFIESKLTAQDRQALIDLMNKNGDLIPLGIEL